MALFRILGSLGLNTSNFEAGLNRAEKKATSFSDRVERKVGRKLDKAFGTGLIAGLAFNQVKNLFNFLTDIPEKTKSIDDLRKKLGLTAVDVQAIQKLADEAGMSFDDFLKAVSDSGRTNELVDQIRSVREEVTFSAEAFDDLTQRTKIWSSISEWATKKTANAYVDLIQNLTVAQATLQNFFSGKFGFNLKSANEAAIKDLNEQIRQDQLNAAAENKVSEDRLKASLNKQASPALHINQLQQIGAFVNASSNVDINTELQKHTDLLQQNVDQIKGLREDFSRNPFGAVGDFMLGDQ